MVICRFNQDINFELDPNNTEISSTCDYMSLGEGKIKMIGGSTSTITIGTYHFNGSKKLSDDGTDRFLVVGSKNFIWWSF